MDSDDKPTQEEKALLKEVDLMASSVIEGYVEGLRYVRKLGDVLLKTVSKVESELDEIIITWNENVKKPYSVLANAHLFMKYQPLLSKMYFMGKVDALETYGPLKNSSLLKSLRWLNEERNMFAHYSVYKFKLEKKYGESKKRVKTLKKLKSILRQVKILKEATDIAVNKT